jgi:hypothetical protein
MTARFIPRPGVDQQVAERLVQPVMHRVIDMLTDEARRRAPAAKTWVTMRDAKVRPTHVHADGQSIPANLRFLIEKVDGTGYELARQPGDRALSDANYYNCRCVTATVPQAIAETIHGTDVHVDGTVVHGSVETRFPRAAESNDGTSQDEATHFMDGALREVAARLRSGQSR